MPEYLIYFNQQWVGDHPEEWFEPRGPLARAVTQEMRAAGVYVFGGGLEEEPLKDRASAPAPHQRLAADHRRAVRGDQGVPRRVRDRGRARRRDREDVGGQGQGGGGVWLATRGTPLQAAGVGGDVRRPGRSRRGELRARVAAGQRSGDPRQEGKPEWTVIGGAAAYTKPMFWPTGPGPARVHGRWAAAGVQAPGTARPGGSRGRSRAFHVL